jgi:3-oxoadipate CoA-transferase alpha subunit
VYSSPETALADVYDGATILIGGFGGQSIPRALLRTLARLAIKGLTCVFSPGAWPQPTGYHELEPLVASGQVKKLISSLPFPTSDGGVVEKHWRNGKLDLEIVPQGTLAERLRAAGAGLGGVFLPDGWGTRFADGKEVRQFDDGQFLLQTPLRADFALLRADSADSLGNLVYRGTGRNWGPVMAMAASISIAEVDRICEPGGLDPEVVMTPGIFVNRIVQVVAEQL